MAKVNYNLYRTHRAQDVFARPASGQASQASLTLSRLDLTEEVIVLVGPAAKRLMIHSDVLVRHSTFFRAALTGRFLEAKKKITRLPETDPEEFAIFAQWAYTGELIVMDPQDAEADTAGRDQRRLLIRTYVLADQLGIIRLQNQAIDDYIKLMNIVYKIPGEVDIASVYEYLLEGSTMRQLMIDYHVSHKKASSMKETAKLLLEEFIRECLVAFVEAMEIGKPPVDPTCSDKCCYHVHNEEEPTCT